MRAVIKREPADDKQTLGEMKVYNDQEELVFTCKTLELPWKDNQRRVSCIPPKTYNVIRRAAGESRVIKSEHFLINGVKDRDGICIHSGNRYDQIMGCVLVGSAHQDINQDGYKDVISSRSTMEKLLGLLTEPFRLTIESDQSDAGGEPPVTRDKEDSFEIEHSTSGDEDDDSIDFGEMAESSM